MRALLRAALADEIRAAAEWARAELVEGHDWPLDEEWTTWRPPADWTVPPLPDTPLVAEARRLRCPSMKVLVLNGPNLGRLGRRQPEIYGTTTHAELAHQCVEWGSDLGLDVEVRQTNHEGELLDWLNTAADDGVPRRAQRGRVDALLARALGRVRPAHRPAGRGAHLRPQAAAGGVPPHLGRRAARRSPRSPAQGIDGYRQALASRRATQLTPRVAASAG